MENLDNYLYKYIWAKEAPNKIPCWAGLHYIDEIDSIRLFSPNDKSVTGKFCYLPNEIQLVKILLKEEALSLEIGQEIIILDKGSTGFGEKVKLSNKIVTFNNNTLVINKDTYVYDNCIGIIEDDYKTIPKEDVHAGMILNPITGKWSWL